MGCAPGFKIRDWCVPGGYIKMLTLLPHGLVSTLFTSSLLPIIPLRFRRGAKLAAHATLALFYLFLPSVFLEVTVTGHFNTLHSFLQAFVASTHLGTAVFQYLTETDVSVKPEQAILFGRTITAFFCLFTRLFAAWHLSEKSTRGLLISDYFIACTLLSDGIWFLTELVQLIMNRRTSQEEVDSMLKRANLWLENKGSFYMENALFIDSALSIAMALFHFAFPQHILKLIIKPEHNLDSHHIMWCRLFGCLNLYPALTSVQARFFSTETQINYIASRLMSQTVVFVVNIFDHWILGIYSANHITGFMISGFYMSFLFSTYHRMKKHYNEKVEHQENVTTTTRIETRTIKKTN